MNESTTGDFVVEHTHLVTPRSLPTGALTKALREMADNGQVGDSFTCTGKPSTSIKCVARNLGLEVICRKLNSPGEKDKKKLRYRVWRSDGLSEEEVNDIVKLRMEGKPVPPPKKCVPPTPEEIAKAKSKRGGKRGRPTTADILGQVGRDGV